MTKDEQHIKKLQGDLSLLGFTHHLTTQREEEIYETVFGDDAINRYTHEELISMLDEMYDCYKYVVDNIYSRGSHIGDKK